MKKNITYILLIGAAILLITYGYKNKRCILNLVNKIITSNSENTIHENKSEPVLASFSFNYQENNQIIDSFLHYTVKLHPTNKWDKTKEYFEQITDDIPILITVETWGNGISSSYLNNPLDDVLKGKFDKCIEILCKDVIKNSINVYLRFDPDMEVPVTRYPWQYHGGSAYIEAFRYFANLCKAYAPQAKQVWGPAGYPGTMECYPGDDVVDAVSITLKSDSEMSLNVYPKNYSVEYDLFRRIHRLRFIKKPVFILGSSINANDSVDQHLINNLNRLISNEKDIIYSEENYTRHELIFNEKSKLTEKFEIGFYDPQSLLINENAVTVEHLFADFGNLDDGTFKQSFSNVINREHNVIVTFEPFRNPDGKTDLKVLKHISEGMYDNEIKHLYSIILSTDRNVYLRFAHEMEIPITRYPWQSQNPITYIKSFRHFMNFMGTLPSNIRRIWGPAGDRGSLEWWPGNDVVDFISIAIYGLPDKNITDPEKQESYETIFNRKNWRMRFVDKPLFITEFGVKGPKDYQTKWLEAAAKVIHDNPQIKGINYFNMSDTPLAWGEIKPPDWSITKESFYKFLEVLNKE